MSYVVLVAQSVELKIAEWELPPDLFEKVYEWLLKQLPSEGTRALKSLPHPLDIWGLSFALDSEAEPNTQHVFTFEAKIAQDEQSIVIVDCGYSRITTGKGQGRLPFGPDLDPDV